MDHEASTIRHWHALQGRPSPRKCRCPIQNATQKRGHFHRTTTEDGGLRRNLLNGSRSLLWVGEIIIRSKGSHQHPQESERRSRKNNEKLSIIRRLHPLQDRARHPWRQTALESKNRYSPPSDEITSQAITRVSTRWSSRLRSDLQKIIRLLLLAWNQRGRHRIRQNLQNLSKARTKTRRSSPWTNHQEPNPI